MAEPGCLQVTATAYPRGPGHSGIQISRSHLGPSAPGTGQSSSLSGPAVDWALCWAAPWDGGWSKHAPLSLDRQDPGVDASTAPYPRIRAPGLILPL